MAITVELVRGGVVTDGIDLWWDTFESVLEARGCEFPLLARVDPYNDVTFPAADLEGLSDELDRIAEVDALANEPVAKLQQLARDGKACSAELRFRGD